MQLNHRAHALLSSMITTQWGLCKQQQLQCFARSHVHHKSEKKKEIAHIEVLHVSKLLSCYFFIGEWTQQRKTEGNISPSFTD